MTRIRPVEAAVLLVCFVAMAYHQSFRWDWYIDDAAICFAYARNLAEGWGAVPWPGGERIEAYSDPTWVGLLAAFYLVGLDGFEIAKPLGVFFGGWTLWFTWRLAREVMPEHRGPGALIAPIALAGSAQFAIWSQSGLENPLFIWLLAWALLRTVRESRDGSSPWASLLWLLLAWSRPEGILYGAVGGAYFAVATWRAGRGVRPVVVWLALFWVPFVASEVLRYWYFAWPLPNTFYAKVSSRGVAPLDWSRRGWWQLREWSERLWHGYFSPVYLLGLVGLGERSGPRLRLGLVGLGLLALSLLWPGPEDLRSAPFWPALPEPPAAFVVGRLLAISAGLALAPLLALGSPGGGGRALCGWIVGVGLGFSVYADGDWMGAYRWMSLVTPALAVLFAAGVSDAADAVERRVSGGSTWQQAGWVAAALLVSLSIPPNVWQTRDHVAFNRNETTASVKLRVDYTRSIVRRTFWDEPVTNLDVDQGAHLWWAPDYWEVDMAMLVDVPMARHWYQQRDFMREYVFEERRPTFAHVGGWWAKYTGFRKYPEWGPTYFELPGYQNLPPQGWFRNVFARRELVMAKSWSGPSDRRVRFDWNVALAGFEQPAPWVPGRHGFLAAGMAVLEPRHEGQDVKMLAFLATEGQVVATFDLPPGYGLYPMHWWKVGQVFRGRHAVTVPSSLKPGTYDLGFVVTGPRGAVLPALELPPGAVAEPPVFARGEVRFPGAIEVIAPEALGGRIEQTRDRLRDLTKQGECGRAEATWVRLQRHRPTDWAWHSQQRKWAAPRIASCWARRAEAEADPVPMLADAYRWDPENPDVAEVGAPLSERLLAEGHAARAREDWEVAYDRFTSVLAFEPWRAWARRYAEEARDRRFDLHDDVRIGIGGDNDLRELEEQQAKGGAR